MSVQFSPHYLTLIDALARQIAQDYLTAQAAAQRDREAKRSDHVPLLPIDQAA